MYDYIEIDPSNNLICDDKKPTKLSILCYSCLVFITNAIAAFFKEYYLYSFLFFILTITSLIFHSNNNIYTNVIDKIAILSIVLYGSYILYNKTLLENRSKIRIFVIITTFLLTLFLFFYGYCNNCYCYNEDKCIGDKYHSLLHLISSIGHHFIIYL
jgi:hypothetical protein